MLQYVCNAATRQFRRQRPNFISQKKKFSQVVGKSLWPSPRLCCWWHCGDDGRQDAQTMLRWLGLHLSWTGDAHIQVRYLSTAAAADAKRSRVAGWMLFAGAAHSWAPFKHNGWGWFQWVDTSTKMICLLFISLYHIIPLQLYLVTFIYFTLSNYLSIIDYTKF